MPKDPISPASRLTKPSPAAPSSRQPPAFRWPHGKKFAFAIIDDTDVATVANVRPVYRLLEQFGLQATKTVWPMACPEGSRHFSSSETLDDPEYLAFVQDLQRRGFEIASHGATMETSTRERTLLAMERFREAFGSYPRVHANHSFNQENLYWGSERIDQPLVKWIYERANRAPRDYYGGHRENSPHWWGDLCTSRIDYVRNLTFNSLDLSRINPSMPYTDPRRPLVKWWYSAADAEDAGAFARLLSSRNQDQLEANGGFTIVATHFGKQFATNGVVDSQVRLQLEELCRRDGWFCSVGDLLDWLRLGRTRSQLPSSEWNRMQRLWLRDLLVRKLGDRMAGVRTRRRTRRRSRRRMVVNTP